MPTVVEKLAGHKIVDVDCGSGDAHTLCLEDNGQLVCVICKIEPYADMIF